MTSAIAVIVAISVTCALAWAYFTAQRLNRLHIRTDAAFAQLMSTLDRRDSLIAALEPELKAHAVTSLSIPGNPEKLEERARADALMTQQLRGRQLAPEIIDAAARVDLAVRFYNDAVTSTRALRTRPLVRYLHLGGTAKLPRYYEVEEASETTDM